MPRTKPMRDAGLAISLLTIIPTPARWPDDEPTTVSGWFPLAGLVVGASGWAFVHGISELGWDGRAPFLVAALVVAIWAFVTRLLHWDGLADFADGLWGGHTPERRLEIMSDSHTGAFGATAIALTVAIEVAAVGSIIAAGHERPLLFVPAVARLAATFAAWLGSPARTGGLGRSVMRRPDVATILPALIVLVLVGMAAFTGYGSSGFLFVTGALVLTLGVPHVLSIPVGGVTGDVMGASVVICEVGLLAAAALLWGV